MHMSVMNKSLIYSWLNICYWIKEFYPSLIVFFQIMGRCLRSGNPRAESWALEMTTRKPTNREKWTSQRRPSLWRVGGPTLWF